MNRKGVAERFAALGFGCDVWTDPPGQVWVDFVHDVDEIVMLIEGEIEVSFAGKTLHPGPGEEIVIPAGASHTVRTAAEGMEYAFLLNPSARSWARMSRTPASERLRRVYP